MLREQVVAGLENIVDEPLHSQLPDLVSTLRTHQPGNPLASEQKFWVLGTSHVNRSSSEDVWKLIRAVKPQVVMIALCRDRQHILCQQDPPNPTVAQLLSQLRQRTASPLSVVFHYFMARIAHSLGIPPGCEFRAAVEAAQECEAAVCFGDRPLDVTMARLWDVIPMRSRLRLLWSLFSSGLFVRNSQELESTIEGRKEADVMTQAFVEMGHHFPQLLTPLITERDEYMVMMMRSIAASSSRIVAVVGAGHLPGIREHWESDIDLKAISSAPPQQRLIKPYVWAVTAVTVIAVAAVSWRRHTAATITYA